MSELLISDWVVELLEDWDIELRVGQDLGDVSVIGGSVSVMFMIGGSVVVSSVVGDGLGTMLSVAST